MTMKKKLELLDSTDEKVQNVGPAPARKISLLVTFWGYRFNETPTTGIED